MQLQQILDKLTQSRLLKLAEELDIAGLTGKKKDEIAAAFHGPLQKILEMLKRDELKELCRNFGLDDSGREKDVLVARLAGKATQKAAQAPAAKPAKQGSKDKAKRNGKEIGEKSLESWIWDAACSIRGAKDAPKYKDYILPLIFTKRLCDVFDDELNRIAAEVGSRAKAFQLVRLDWHKVTDKKKAMVRFFLPLEPKDSEESIWSVIRKLSSGIGEHLTTHLRAIAKENPLLQGIIDRVDFNATTHGQRDIDDDRLSNLIEAISNKRLGLKDVEADIIGKSYEYLIRKFAEGSGQSADEFYTPGEVGAIMARVMDPAPGMEIYDPCCGSGGLLIKCELALYDKMKAAGRVDAASVKLYGQEYVPETWAMANMNMIIHDMEGQIEIGDTFKNPKFRKNGKLRTFDRVVANPMWNQDWFTESDYDNDELDRFPVGAGFPHERSRRAELEHSRPRPADQLPLLRASAAEPRQGSGGRRDAGADRPAGACAGGLHQGPVRAGIPRPAGQSRLPGSGAGNRHHW